MQGIAIDYKPCFSQQKAIGGKYLFNTETLNTEYDVNNKIEKISQGNKELKFLYSSTGNRIKTEYKVNNTLQKTVYYIGNYECEVYPNGRIREINYINTSTGHTIVQLKDNKNNIPTDSLYYIFKDHLGSYDRITNQLGQTVETYSFDAWGNRRQASDWTIKDVSETRLFTRGFTGHEHLDAFETINMNGRLYDPTIARFLSPDPYVASNTFTQDYNRYSYCRNNPLLYTDPSGENPLLVVATVYTLFFTDFGYDVQKAFSPIAVKFDLRFGSNQGGVGIDASFGIPQVLPISYRKHVGATYFWKNTDLIGNNMSGWETRNGGEWAVSSYMLGIPFMYRYSGTTFNSKWSGKQTTNTHFLGNPLINLSYENDMKPGKALSWIPWVPQGDGDRYRTAAFQFNIGPFAIGTNMITGDAGPDRLDRENWERINGHATYMSNNGYDPNSHRSGIIYFKAGPFRLGWNSEKNRKVFQNQFAHDFLTGGESKWFEVLSLKPLFYWQFGYSGGGTLW